MRIDGAYMARRKIRAILWEDCAQQVRRLVELEQSSRSFFGGPPFSSEVLRELLNHDVYIFKGLPKRSRFCFGSCAIRDADGVVVGYQSATILRHATPTAYERRYVGLRDELSCLHGKRLIVHPEYRGTGVAEELLEHRLTIARIEGLCFVCDVHASNTRVQAFYRKHGIYPRFAWHTRSRKLMFRLTNE